MEQGCSGRERDADDAASVVLNDDQVGAETKCYGMVNVLRHLDA